MTLRRQSRIAAASGAKISALPSAASTSPTDQFEVNQGGTTRSLTFSQIGASRLPAPTGTDDTLSIQAAMDANPGSTVVIPEGIYRVTTLTIPAAGITLVGEGPGSVIRQLPSASNMMALTATSAVVQLIGLTLDGNHQGQSGTTTQASIRLQALDTTGSPSRFVFRNCRFVNGRSTDVAIFAPDSATVQTYVEITGCFFLGGLDPGRYTYCQGTIDALVEGNTFDFDGPHLVAGRSGVVFDDFGSDGTATNRGTATIANNYFCNCGTGVPAAIGAIDFYSGFSQITISGNRVIEPWGRGINVKNDAGGVAIVGNTVVGLNQVATGGAMTAQIILLSSVSAVMNKGNVVAGNVCLDSDNDGIVLFGNGNNAGAEYKRTMLAASNVVVNPARYCFYTYETGVVELKGNSTRGGTHGLYSVNPHFDLIATGNTFDLAVSHAVNIQCTAGVPDCNVMLTGNHVIQPGGRGMHVTFAGDTNISNNSIEVAGNPPLYIVNTTGTRLIRNNAIKSDTAAYMTEVTNSGPLYADQFNPTNQSFSLNYPDGGIAGGITRGLRAIDLQQSRTVETQVANGTNSWAFGSGNTVSATNSGALGVGNMTTANTAIAMGNLNIADGINSMTIGFRAHAKARYGFKGWANGRFAATGDAQMGDIVLRASTASTAPATLTADAAAPGAANIINLVNNSALRLDITLLVRDSASDVASFTANGVTIRRTSPASNTFLVGAPVFVAGDKTAGFAAMALPTLAADTINGGLNISVVALGTNATHWVASVKVTEIQ